MISPEKTKEDLIKDLHDLRQSYDALQSAFEKNSREQEKIQQALMKSEKQYRLLAKNSSDVIWTLDNEYCFTFISPSIYELRGLTPDEAMKEAIQDTMPSWSLEVVQEAIVKGKEHEIAKNHTPVKIQIQQYHKNGNLIWVELSVRAMLDDCGAQIGYVGNSRDITKRKIAEMKVRASEENFRRLADLAKIVISIVADAAGSKYLYVNKEWERAFGYTREESKDLAPIDIVAPEYRQLVLDNAAKRYRGEEVSDIYDLKTISKSGEVKFFEFSSTIIHFENQKAFLTTSVEITERKLAEAELLRREEELRALNAQKDKFLSIISHDLKNPLGAVMTLSELLEDQLKSGDHNDTATFAAMIRQSSTQAMNLLTDLLDWSSSQTGRMVFLPRKFELGEMIDEVLQFAEFSASRKAITLQKASPEKLEVYADQQMIGTVLRNLISNAVKFTRPGGEVSLSVESKEHEVIVSVRDNGVGIEPERMERLFRLDGRASTTGTAKEVGTGLGLVLCKDFVERHGGRLSVESRLGEGSAFSFVLPYSPDGS